jgi:hypothetical protein
MENARSTLTNVAGQVGHANACEAAIQRMEQPSNLAPAKDEKKGAQ